MIIINHYNIGAMGQEARSFFKEVARHIVAITNEPQTLQFLQQRVAVAVQRGNAASILGSAVVGDGSLIFSWCNILFFQIHVFACCVFRFYFNYILLYCF